MTKGCLPRFVRRKPNHEQQLLEGPTISYDTIYELCCNRDGSGDLFQRFLPDGAVKELVTEANVLSTLQSNDSTGRSKDIQRLTSYVVKNARKTFLILIFSDTLHHLWLLHDANFTDQSLPVTKHLSETPDGKSTLRLEPSGGYSSEGADTKAIETRNFSSTWKKKECNDFYQHQWMFLAPTFEARTFEYQLEPDVPLPYIPSYRLTEPASGYFGLVQKVGLLNDHHNHLAQLQVASLSLQLKSFCMY